MKSRYAYPLLFLVPSAVVAVIVMVLTAAAGAGILWLFVYGDDPWPAWADGVLTSLAALVGLLVLAACLLIAYRAGKSQESRGGLRKSHVLVALGLSVGLPLLVLFHQWQVGNLGDSQVPPNNSSKPMPLRYGNRHDRNGLPCLSRPLRSAA